MVQGAGTSRQSTMWNTGSFKREQFAMGQCWADYIWIMFVPSFGRVPSNPVSKQTQYPGEKIQTNPVSRGKNSKSSSTESHRGHTQAHMQQPRDDLLFYGGTASLASSHLYNAMPNPLGKKGWRVPLGTQYHGDTGGRTPSFPRKEGVKYRWVPRPRGGRREATCCSPKKKKMV